MSGGSDRSRPGRAAIALAVLVCLFMLAPLMAVVPVSFTPNRYLSMPDGDYSLRHYRALVENPAWAASFWMSLKVAAVASLIATALATGFSLGIWMFRPRFTPLWFGIALLPMVAPPVVSALTLYFLLVGIARVNPLFGFDSFPGVVLAHVVMIAPFAVVLTTVALAQVDRRIDLAARGLGAGIWTRVFRVLLPNIRFGVLTALFLTFVMSWEEIGVTLFVTSVQTITLPRQMWMGLRDNIDPAIAAISVLLILVVVSMVVLRTIWTHAAGRNKE